jgi:hypothetical protein
VVIHHDPDSSAGTANGIELIPMDEQGDRIGDLQCQGSLTRRRTGTTGSVSWIFLRARSPVAGSAARRSANWHVSCRSLVLMSRNDLAS